MIPSNRTATHPGEVLRDEFLAELGIPQTELAAKLGIPVQRINEIVNGKRGITPDTAWLFAGAFGTTPEFWMNLQPSTICLAIGLPGLLLGSKGDRPQAHATWPSCRATAVPPQHDGSDFVEERGNDRGKRRRSKHSTHPRLNSKFARRPLMYFCNDGHNRFATSGRL